MTRAELLPYIRSLHGPILVTGAAGFIGASLFKMVAAERSDVFAVARRGNSWRLADVNEDQFIAVDLTDQSAVKNLLNNVTPQTVFDCVAYGAYSFERNTGRIYETNFLSVVGFAELLAARSISAFVHAGSSSEYGTNSAGPREDAVLEPNSDYAVSKVATSSYLRYMGRHRAFPCANLRLYSVYGPLEDTSRLIPNLVHRALAGGYPRFVDPRISRDFVYIDDVCAAFILTAAKMNPQMYGASFNIGSGTRTTIAELAALTKRIFGLQSDPEFGEMPARDWDLTDWYADPAAANEVLGWTAGVSLDEGLRSTARWVGGLDDERFSLTGSKAAVKEQRSLTAIIACYKDGQAIPVMYRRLTDTFRKLRIDYEIIFVNDASPDDSAEIIRQLSDGDHHVIGISHSRNFGSQMAFRSGMEIATKDGVVLLDGDLQDPPELIEAFYAKWEQGFDVTYGRRVKREMNFLWNAAYKTFYRVFAAFSYVPIPLDAGDFSLMDRKVVGWILQCPERDLFVRGLRAYVGFRQDGVDYVRPDRTFGHSTNNLFKNIEWAKKGIFSFSNTPLTVLTTAGVVSLAVSLLLAVVTATLRLLVPNIAPRGATTILIAILLFGSFNLFAIGLVGEYIAKIMAEVKGRPRLIRAALIRDGTSTELLPDGKVF
jgi:nucleoside-diphosphate-sugar epimerase/glycosyltransferase involved in cell wall biosynthesis